MNCNYGNETSASTNFKEFVSWETISFSRSAGYVVGYISGNKTVILSTRKVGFFLTDKCEESVVYQNTEMDSELLCMIFRLWGPSSVTYVDINDKADQYIWYN